MARHEGHGDEQRTARLRPQIRQCEEAAEQFVDAPLQTFVPILVEHIVRNRLMESRRQPRRPWAEPYAESMPKSAWAL
ncbi:three-helix bundle dimerization domain-containing protein [Mycobacterium angelicum]|uniref:Uncharacterized protein n=1 Tax=Mycobacterium angelicum TaxID=470074 RepID=A0A1X0A927_MYCAN|nr:hypothetical protein [Mycobacterium angelicum]MCV7197685.1 hypothetical protein [Mycobacterium angelicum]ORA26550.1 hypothetical protein BST12_01395 [Mycobacterium angelicum]